VDAQSIGPGVPVFMTPADVAVEREISFDMVRRGLIISPVILIVAGLLRGVDGLVSAAIALAIVFVNFLCAAAIMTRAAKSGPTALGAAALFGYILRLGVVLAALVALRHQPWIDMATLGIVLVGTHMGLLFWEMKYVSISLAAPGLHPTRPGPLGEQ
jgi:hypothetical protein